MKRRILLVMAVGALLGLAAPAAQADVWAIHGETVANTTATGSIVDFTGELATTAGGGAVKNGNCEVHAQVRVWNVGGVSATGEVEGFQITTPCPISSPLPIIPPGCTLEEATSEAFPWHIDVSNTTGISITNANFTNHYAGCAPTLPGEFTATGTATGQAENVSGGSCIVFNNSGDLASPNGAVTIDGKVCATGLTLTS